MKQLTRNNLLNLSYGKISRFIDSLDVESGVFFETGNLQAMNLKMVPVNYPHYLIMNMTYSNLMHDKINATFPPIDIDSPVIIDKRPSTILLQNKLLRCIIANVEAIDVNKYKILDHWVNKDVVLKAYAITCHKAQCKTFNTSIGIHEIHKQHLMDHRWMYVATTRATSKKQITLFCDELPSSFSISVFNEPHILHKLPFCDFTPKGVRIRDFIPYKGPQFFDFPNPHNVTLKDNIDISTIDIVTVEDTLVKEYKIKPNKNKFIVRINATKYHKGHNKLFVTITKAKKIIHNHIQLRLKNPNI